MTKTENSISIIQIPQTTHNCFVMVFFRNWPQVNILSNFISLTHLITFKSIQELLRSMHCSHLYASVRHNWQHILMEKAHNFLNTVQTESSYARRKCLHYSKLTFMFMASYALGQSLTGPLYFLDRTLLAYSLGSSALLTGSDRGQGKPSIGV